MSRIMQDYSEIENGWAELSSDEMEEQIKAMHKFELRKIIEVQDAELARKTEEEKKEVKK